MHEYERDIIDHEDEYQQENQRIEALQETVRSLEHLKASIEANQLVSKGTISQYFAIAGDNASPIALENFTTRPSKTNIAMSLDAIKASLEMNKFLLIAAIAAVAVGVVILIRKLIIYIRNRKTDVGKSTSKLKESSKEWNKEAREAEKEASKGDDTRKRAMQAAQSSIDEEFTKAPNARRPPLQVVEQRYTMLVEHIFVENNDNILRKLTQVHSQFNDFTKTLLRLSIGVEELLKIYHEVQGHVDLNASDSTNAIMQDMENVSKEFKERNLVAFGISTEELFAMVGQKAEFTANKLNAFEENLTRSSTMYFIDRLESFALVGTDKNSNKIDDPVANRVMNLLEEIKRAKEIHVDGSDEFFARFNPLVDSLKAAVTQYKSLLELFIKVADEYLFFITAVGNIFNIRKEIYKRFMAEIKSKGKDPNDQKFHNYQDIHNEEQG